MDEKYVFKMAPVLQVAVVNVVHRANIYRNETKQSLVNVSLTRLLIVEN